MHHWHGGQIRAGSLDGQMGAGAPSADDELQWSAPPNDGEAEDEVGGCDDANGVQPQQLQRRDGGDPTLLHEDNGQDARDHGTD